MGILHVINITTFGGAENLLISFLPALAERKLFVSCAIFCPSKTPEAAKKIKAELETLGITVHYKEFRSPWEISNFTWLKKIIRKEEFDIVHCHLRHPEVWVSAIKLLGRKDFKVVTTVHGYNDRYMNRYGLKMLRRAYFSGYYWATRLVSGRIDGFIYVSEYVKKFCSKASFGKGKSNVVIYHGYPNQPYHPETVILDKPLLVKPGLVLYGRTVERKGHIYAVKALKILQQKYKEAELHIFGTGVFEKKLRDFIGREGMSNAVFFHGYKNNIIEELRKYDIALLPSYGEPFGLVFLDAFTAQIPVVAFDLPAGNEIIKNNFNGLLAFPYNAESLAEKIDLLCIDIKTRELITENALISLKTQFSMGEMVDKHIKFYSSIVEKRTLS